MYFEIQDFLIRLLAKNSFAGVDRQHGRFRSFLLACLKNFLSQTREHNCAIKRGGGQLPVSLDAGEVPEPGVAGWDDLDFDRSWAESTLAQATDALRQEYIRAGKDKQFEDLKPFILGGQCDLSRSDLARKEGVELGTIDVAVHRLRRRYGVILRAKVRQAVSSESDVEMEIIYLMRALAEKSP